MEKNKRNKIIGLTLGILIVLIIVVSSTYAYWQITKTQKDANDIVAACLDITMQNETGTFGLSKAWPISDSEGEALTGYTFEVKNNCDENVNYIVGLNSVEGSSDNYLDYSSLKLKLDDKDSSLISDFGDIGYSDPENKEVVRDSKLLSMESLDGNGTATHNVKVWIDKDAPVEEQGKLFRGQIFITGGQGLPIQKECFAINTEGTILSYDYSCGTDVAVPVTIAGIEVKKIDESSFLAGNIQIYSLYNEETDEGKEIYYITDENVADDIVNLLKQDICEDPPTCTLEDIDVMGLKVITTEEEYNAIDFEQYETSGYIVEGPMKIYFNSETGEFEEATSQVTSLDLSNAIYLEEIGDYAFNGSETLEKITLPSDGVLKLIGYSAFSYTQIREVDIPTSVETIEEHAFAGGKLQKVVFEGTEDSSSQLETIENNAFDGNQITGTLVIPSSVETIGNSAFSSNQITEAVVGAKTIGPYAFTNNKLTSVTIGANVETIKEHAFNIDYTDYEDGNRIKTLTFEDTELNPSQLATIENYAFPYNRIEKIIIPSSVETIGVKAFAYNQITEAVVGAKTIGQEAFLDNQLTSVTIGANVETIGARAFRGRWNCIVNLTIEDTKLKPSQLTTIGQEAFWGNQINGLVIPSSTETIDYLAFFENPITEVIIKNIEENVNVIDAFPNNVNIIYNPNYTE